MQGGFRRLLGVTPRQYAAARRVASLKTGLRRARDVTQALYDAGYGSSSRLYESSDAELGMTPATYRRGGRGMQIAYTVQACPLGRLLVAATDRGVAAVSLGDADAPLESALRTEYPEAQLRRDPGALSRWVAAILAHLEGERPDLDLPVDVVATAFQRRVWQALRAIPYGQTRSYAEIARALGKPRASRAVARACAANPTALVVPCQRVVAADGTAGGYRWGAARKRALLAREAAAAGSLRR